MSRSLKAFGLLLDLVLLAASIATGGPVSIQVERLAIFVVAVVGGLVVFCGVVLLRGRPRSVTSQTSELGQRGNDITPFDCPRDNARNLRATPEPLRNVSVP
jgi:hypothetical protein